MSHPEAIGAAVPGKVLVSAGCELEARKRRRQATAQLAPEERARLRDSWSMPQGDLLGDFLLIVVGTGLKAERLCARRLAKAGRLLWLHTDEQPARHFSNTHFVFRPPDWLPQSAQVEQLKSKYQAEKQKEWVKKGPDILALQPGETYEVCMGEHGCLRVCGPDKKVRWHMPGRVVFAKDAHPEQFNVDVTVDAYLTLKVPNPWHMAVWALYCFVLMGAYMYMLDFDYAGAPPYWRGILWGVYAFPFGQIIPTVWGHAFNGEADRSTVALLGVGVQSFVCMAVTNVFPLEWLGNAFGMAGPRYFSMFCVGVVVCTLLLCCWTPIHFLRTGWPHYWTWGIMEIAITLGAWVGLYAVTLLYIVLCVDHEHIANLLFPIWTAILESGLIIVLQWTYAKLVYEKNAHGEQGNILVISACTVHFFAESSRLIALLCSTAISGSYAFVSSLVMSIVINICARHGWTRFMTVKLITALKLNPSLFRPSMVTKIHDQVKFTCGYPRFVVPLAYCVANAIKGRSPVLFNDAALHCLLMCLAFELIEDVVVHSEIVPYSPSPLAGLFTKWTNMHPFQLYTHDRAGDLKRADAEELPEERDEWADRSNSIARHTGGPVTGYTGVFSRLYNLKPLPHALPLYGVGDLTFGESAVLMTAACVFSPCLMQLILGAGYVAGVCSEPIAPDKRLSEAILLPQPLECP